MSCIATRHCGAAVILILVVAASPAHAQADAPPPKPIFTQNLSDLDALLIVQSWWHVGDMIGTAYGIKHGAYETNPILAPFTNNPVALSVVSGSLAVLEAYALQKLVVRHRKLAHILAGALLAAEVWATTNNVRAAGELQRRGSR